MIICTFEDGGNGHLRHTCVDAIVLNKTRDQVYLCRRSDKVVEGGKWSMWGGFLNRNETMIEGLLREVFEESGYKAKVVDLLRINDNPNRRGEDRQNVQVVFVLEIGERAGKEDWETAGGKWFSLDELPDEEEMAFDHLSSLKMIKDYKAGKLKLPVIG